MSTKVDVLSFRVILMETVTGRKALDETQPEESMHLVTWCPENAHQRGLILQGHRSDNRSQRRNAGDISTVAELAGHCCAREPYQRPDMGHAVNVLSSLVEMSLSQALKKWQANEGRSHLDSSSSSLLPSLDDTQTSIPTRPYGFAESFTSADGR